MISSIQPAAGWAGRRAGQTRSASLLSLRRGEGTQKTRQNYITSISISSYTQMDVSHCSGYSMYWFVTNILNLLPTHFHVYSFVLLILQVTRLLCEKDMVIRTKVNILNLLTSYKIINVT